MGVSRGFRGFIGVLGSLRDILGGVSRDFGGVSMGLRMASGTSDEFDRSFRRFQRGVKEYVSRRFSGFLEPSREFLGTNRGLWWVYRCSKVLGGFRGLHESFRGSLGTFQGKCT